MKYLSVAEAKKMPGLRLVLTAHMPGPWGEAAKAVLSARHVSYVPVAQAAMEANDDLYAWTGLRNAPIAVFDEEPAQNTWLDILLLAERLGPVPRCCRATRSSAPWCLGCRASCADRMGSAGRDGSN